MENKLITAALTVILTLGLTSCGKKASDHKPKEPDNSVEEVEPDKLELETHKDLKAAIVAHDLIKVKSILDKKVKIDLNIILDGGETLMSLAVAHNQPQMIELLMENFATITKTNSKKQTPLMVAAINGHESLVRHFVKLGAKTDSKDLNGNTALHLAILNAHEDVALYLINSNTNIDITNNDHLNALKLAEASNLPRVITLLRSLTQSSVGIVDRVTVRNLIKLGDVENLNQLFIRYPSVLVDYVDLNYYVLVMRSHPYDKALQLTELLLKHNASLEATGDANETPLIEAIKSNYPDFVTLMLAQSGVTNVHDINDVSPLVWAIRQNSPVMVKALLGKGASTKYVSTITGKKKTIKACDVARTTRSKLKTDLDKVKIENIMKALECGLRGFL